MSKEIICDYNLHVICVTQLGLENRLHFDALTSS